MSAYDTLVNSFNPNDPTAEDYWDYQLDPLRAAFNAGGPSALPASPEPQQPALDPGLSPIQMVPVNPKPAPVGNPGDVIPPTVYQGIRTQQILDAQQAYEKAHPVATKLESILKFVAPAAQALMNAQMVRRRERTRMFLASLAGGEVNPTLQTVMQPQIQRAAAQQQAQGEYAQLLQAIKAQREGSNQQAQAGYWGNMGQAAQTTAAANMKKANNPEGTFHPVPGTNLLYNDKTRELQPATPPPGGIVPSPAGPVVPMSLPISAPAAAPDVPMGANLTPAYPTDAELRSTPPAPNVPFTFPANTAPKGPNTAFQLWHEQYPDEPVGTWMKFQKDIAKSGRQPTDFEFKSWLYDHDREKFNGMYGDKTPKPKGGTPDQFAKLEQWKAKQFQSSEGTQEANQAIEDTYGAQLQQLGGDWNRTIYGPDGRPINVSPASAPNVPMTAAPTGSKGKALDRATAAAILQEAGGNKARARYIAKQRGYQF